MFVVVVSTESLGDDGANRSAGSHRTLGGDRQLIDLGRVNTTITSVGFPADLTTSQSTSTSASPAFTCWPSLTIIVNGDPASCTVSTPMCTSTSTPAGVVMPTACLAWATVVILPATGATTRPDVGTTANPSPRILAAKVSSGTSVIGLMAPSTGASTALSAAFTLGAGAAAAGAAVTLLGNHHR